MKSHLIVILCLVGIAVGVMIQYRPWVSDSHLTIVPVHSGDRLADPSMNEEAQVLQLRFAKLGPEHERADASGLYVKIADPIKPLERWKKYEEPLAIALREKNLGNVTGGGTMRQKDGTIKFCGIDVAVSDVTKAVPVIKEVMRTAGAPKGSQIEYIDSHEIVAIIE